ncbi:hypothetical protein AKJ65_02055 [candidate division MSBL1 archaeon SCGC-AAA259E19]|uniref:Uncharacterized protein n=1 Tax=candidate division MSBL1 archaeon SCGC-AAA259E19 TaxID=1698264 RepID=A0A133UMG6_9EURY|nr:hypothetical protein AKJ65_02055 [candidate division MSBL1 archaeon SCGC-AAA259E19]
MEIIGLSKLKTIIQISFRRTPDRSEVRITLRKWFTRKMQNQKVSGEYIDAFCGQRDEEIGELERENQVETEIYLLKKIWGTNTNQKSFISRYL